MKQTLKHFLRVATGIGLVLLGIVGLILPIMPGWIFLIPGLLILADYFPPLRRMVDWLKAKYEVEKAKLEARKRG
jgi:uncharacterized membrane protein YbaN (DUF454 family)